jgi:hypothetical protein
MRLGVASLVVATLSLVMPVLAAGAPPERVWAGDLSEQGAANGRRARSPQEDRPAAERSRTYRSRR